MPCYYFGGWHWHSHTTQRAVASDLYDVFWHERGGTLRQDDKSAHLVAFKTLSTATVHFR